MEEVKKRGRGKGTKPAMVLSSIRIPQDTFDYFRQFPNMQLAMREALTQYKQQREGMKND